MRAIFPGSFDPVTLGHIDIIKRGARLFDELIIAVLNNPAKQPLFTLEERMHLIKSDTAGLPGVRVECFTGLLAEFAKKREVYCVLRGMRTSADSTYEISMAQANNKLLNGLETVFLASDPIYSYMSSSLVREIASAGYADLQFNDTILDQWVSSAVKKMLKNKLLM